MLQDIMCKAHVCIVLLVSYAGTSPIVTVFEETISASPYIPSNFCLLPPELGTEGNVTFLEDCPSLDRYETIPLPAGDYSKFGTHPVVCCPKVLPESSICFDSDPWCPTYKKPEPVDYSQYSDQLSEYPDDDDYDGIPIQTQQPIFVQDIPKMADKECRVNGQFLTLDGIGEISQCVAINQCGKVLDSDVAPQTQTLPCGFDEAEKLLMVCCPEDAVTKPESIKQKPRFLSRNGRARKVEDKADQCRKWRDNEGCSLDKDVSISNIDIWNGKVLSKTLFGFMQAACLKTCGWASRQECVDEHPRCSHWARTGMCILNSFFMTHTCRESCGVCGFLSPSNKEEQVVGGKSYTDFTRENFDCGRYKPLCEINNTPCNETEGGEETTEAPTVLIEPVQTDTELFDLREDDEDDVFFSSDSPTNGDFFCGATMVTDRWVVAAAHCYDDFEVSASNEPRKIKVNTIRDNTNHTEVIEIKRVFKHPQYKYPNLYDDIAVLELGRRVEYNYDLFGDTPSCIDQGQDNEDRTATVQGYGLTELGERGELLETNVTVINNEYCKEILDSNTTDNKNARSKIDSALPKGLQYGLFCAQGDMNEEGIFKGSCKGDSGGPLTTPNDEGRTTLIGIVSGGIGCGKGYPGWYTHVAFHINWVKCIINNSVRYNNNRDKVMQECNKIVKQPPKCNNEIFGDLRSADPEEDACNSGDTPKTNLADLADLADLRQL